MFDPESGYLLLNSKEDNMKLNGRDLTRGLSGDDVKLLHFELRQLGFTIPDAEVARANFGDGTLKVVMQFQTSHQFRPNGIVDAITAAAINRDFDALPIVLGQVRNGEGKPFTDGTHEKVSGRTKRCQEPLIHDVTHIGDW